MSELLIDLGDLAIRIKNQINNRDLSLRGAAKEIGISAATLSRTVADNNKMKPDVTTIFRLRKWLKRAGLPPDAGPVENPADWGDVEIAIRRLPDVTPDDADLIAGIARQLYVRVSDRA